MTVAHAYEGLPASRRADRDRIVAGASSRSPRGDQSPTRRGARFDDGSATLASVKPSDVLATCLVSSLVVACGGVETRPVAPPARAAAIAAGEPEGSSAAALEEPPAPGTQLAAGRLGTLLQGLRPGGWVLPGAFGPSREGPDAVSHHVMTRAQGETSYLLHVAAWDSLTPSSSSPTPRRRRDPDLRSFESADPALTVSGYIFTPDQDAWGIEAAGALTEDRGLELLAQLEVNVADASVVRVALACAASAACDAEDREALVAALVLSLRRGPRLRGGGEWTLRLPDGDADRGATLTLPEGWVGLAPRQREGGQLMPVVSLATGAVVFHVLIRPVAVAYPWIVELGARSSPPDARARDATIACAPFHCEAHFADESSRDVMLAALASARVTRSEPVGGRIPLARGRLLLEAVGPAIDQYEDRRPELTDRVTTHVRFEGAQLELSVMETLTPVADLLAYARRESSPGQQVDLLEAADPSLRIARALPATTTTPGYTYFTPARLFVAEADGTVVSIELPCERHQPCAEAAERICDALARRLHPGAPLPTTRSLSFRHGGDMIEVTLPDDYAITQWYGEEHGGWGLTAHRVRAPAATLELEDSGDAPDASIENVGRRTGRRTTLVLGTQRFPLLERRAHGGVTLWAADIGGGPASILMIRTEDLAARDSLMSALASARITSIPACQHGIVDDVDPLNVRAAPGTRSRVLGTLEPEVEVTVAETRGSWSRLSAPLEGWVWDRAVMRTCE